jgi:putative spermidine/putrescine transport system substrate-binding protein
MRRNTGFALAISILVFLALAGCSRKDGAEVSGKSDTGADFQSLVRRAKGTTVRFYGWGGDDERNAWLDGTVAPLLKKKYGFELKRVPMDIHDILVKLTDEKQAGKKDGSIDMIWINGENFYSTKGNGLLFGPFTQNLPNYRKYIDATAVENQYDFGYSIDGYEAPYSKAQLVLINDSAITPEAPSSTQELLEYAKKYPGKVTYPSAPDFTGSAFVRNVIDEICGYEQFMGMPADKGKVKAAIEPALKYLRKLNPYLWNKGRTFPSSSPTMDNMFANGELVMSISYEPYQVTTSKEHGRYTKTTRAFLFGNGTIGNTNYIAIAANSPHTAAAMVAINEILSAEVQASQFSMLKALTVVDYGKLTQGEKASFDAVNVGDGAIPQHELLSKRLPEMPAHLVPIIDEIWQEEVVGK